MTIKLNFFFIRPWIKDRIDVNHMTHEEGISSKNVDDLAIKDFVPTHREKDYVFQSMISYFSHRLVVRHPLMYKSLVHSIKPNKPHQFQAAMDRRSVEFTGKLYTKSESNMEDLISMMMDVQLDVNTYEDLEGKKHCYEKKIVSGDNKTEKNMHYGILSKRDENEEYDSLEFIIPSHELFHQSMVVADCINELFREDSRGLEGGLFFEATMLNRREAKTGKGKDSIDSLKDFFLLVADTRFCQFFIKKYDIDPSYDNTPDHLKKASWADKERFLHAMVEDALRDLLPHFSKCSTDDPLLNDHPLQAGRRVISPSNQVFQSPRPWDTETSR